MAIATQGAGAAFTGALAAEGTAGFVMADAGFSALVSQASGSLINNQGDIGKVLQELGSSQTVKTLTITVASAATSPEKVRFTDPAFPNPPVPFRPKAAVRTEEIRGCWGWMCGGDDQAEGFFPQPVRAKGGNDVFH